MNAARRDAIRAKRRCWRVQDDPIVWHVVSTANDYVHQIIWTGDHAVCIATECEARQQHPCWALRKCLNPRRLRAEVARQNRRNALRGQGAT